MVNSTGIPVLCFSDSELAKEPVAMLALEDEFIGDGSYIKLVHLLLVDGQDHGLMVWFKRSCCMVLRKYVLILRMVENDRSLTAFVAGMTGRS